jgi:molybdopterin-guanine dinucleotide biosynthesis protein A
MVCILRGEPSAVPKLWTGMIVAAGDGCLVPLAGRPLLDHVIERARPQVCSLAICARGDPSRFARPGVAAVAAPRAGQLAAVLAGLDWTAAHSRETPWLATFAADAPVFTADLVERLGQGVGDAGADMAWAVVGERAAPVFGERAAPVFGLWPVRLRRALAKAIDRDPGLGVEAWAARYRVAHVELAAAISTTARPYISL